MTLVFPTLGVQINATSASSCNSNTISFIAGFSEQAERGILMDSIFEMHISDSSFTADNRYPLFSVFGERVEYLICLFVSYERSDRDRQYQILGVRSVLVLGFPWFARFGFENGFVPIGLQGIFVFGCFQYNRSSVTAVSS